MNANDWKPAELYDPSKTVPSGDAVAPDGYVYQCQACGKTSPTWYGLDQRNGWDEACVLNAVLVSQPALGEVKE